MNIKTRIGNFLSERRINSFRQYYKHLNTRT